MVGGAATPVRRLAGAGRRFGDALRLALASVVAHGLRSTLTAGGIAIGAAAIVAVMSLLDAFRMSIGAQFEGLGARTVSIRAFTPRHLAVNGQRVRLAEEDVRVIRTRVDGVEKIAPLLVDFDEVSYSGRATATQIQGTTEVYQEVFDTFAASGRFLSRADEVSRRRVCVVGESTREALGLPDRPAGEYIRVGGGWCKVIGVMERRGEFFGASQDDHVTMPYGAMRSIAGPDEGPGELLIQLAVREGTAPLETTAQIRAVLREAHQLGPNEEDDFRIQTAEEIVDAFNQVAAAVAVVVGGMMGVSLLVGGVGIMNVMLVSVSERTREIGISKALGATEGHILVQFLVEAVTLSMLGAIVGLAVGSGIAAFVATLIPEAPRVTLPLSAVALGLGFPALVGIVFGALPAVRAARLQPLQALRHE